MKRRIQCVLGVLTCLQCGVALANATTYYVSNAGSDANDGLSSDMAWETLQHAVVEVEAGDTVMVLPGEYQGFLHSANAGGASGTADMPITYQASGDGVRIVEDISSGIPGGFPGSGNYGIRVIEADHIIIDGFEVSGMSRAGIGIEESHHVTVRNCRATGNGRWGIFTSFANYCTIEHNYCANSSDEHGIYYSNSSKGAIIRYNVSHSNRANGIHMNGDQFWEPRFREEIEVTGVIEGAEIHGNIIYDNGRGGGAGINMDGVQNARIYNNLMYDLHAGGITCYGIDGKKPSQNAKIYNNTIIIASDGRSNIQFADHTTTGIGAIGGKVFNNILINKASRGVIEVHEASQEGLATGYNIVTDKFEYAGSADQLAEWQDRGYGANTEIVGPLEELFLDPGNDDYQLNAPESPAIDTGSDMVSGLVGQDLLGVARPNGEAYDIGAYEHVSKTWGGYPESHSRVQTHDFLGDLYISHEPHIYSYSLGKWVFLRENNINDHGAWLYLYK